MDIFNLWNRKTAQIRSLADRAKKVCSKEDLPKELQLIKKVAITKRVLSKETLNNDVISNEQKITYQQKLGRFTNKRFNLVCRYSVTKISFFTNMKDKLNKLSKSNVVQQFSCPGCESSYIGKTELKLFEKTQEHLICAISAIKRHLDTCLNVKHLFPITNLILNGVNTHEFRLNLVRQNTRRIDESNNWNVLLFKEAYHIKEKCPCVSKRLGKCKSFE